MEAGSRCRANGLGKLLPGVRIERALQILAARAKPHS